MIKYVLKQLKIRNIQNISQFLHIFMKNYIFIVQSQGDSATRFVCPITTHRELKKMRLKNTVTQFL